MSSQWNVAVPAQAVPAPGAPSLSKSYGAMRLVLLPRDPEWIHAYWEISPGYRSAGPAVLRFHFARGFPRADFRTEVELESRESYIRGPFRGARFSADLGFQKPDGRLALLARSNEVRMPMGGPANVGEDGGVVMARLGDRGLTGFTASPGEASAFPSPWHGRPVQLPSSSSFPK